MKVYAIIPAGGKGKRSGVKTPKQYLKINGKELIVYTLETFQKCRLVDEIIIPANPLYFNKLKRLVTKYQKLFQLSEGEERDRILFIMLSVLYLLPRIMILLLFMMLPVHYSPQMS